MQLKCVRTNKTVRCRFESSLYDKKRDHNLFLNYIITFFIFYNRNSLLFFYVFIKENF